MNKDICIICSVPIFFDKAHVTVLTYWSDRTPVNMHEECYRWYEKNHIPDNDPLRHTLISVDKPTRWV